jgi:hypothetical protein
MKLKHYKLILFLAFSGLTTGLKAQTTLSGEIVNKSDAPVSGVKIDFGGGTVQTVSDNNGKFSFTYADTLKTVRFFFSHSVINGNR